MKCKNCIHKGICVDFGTKSTVVVRLEENDTILPIRVGLGDLSKAAEAKHYENPTFMEFIDLPAFIKAYQHKNGRPATSWEHLTVSHAAREHLFSNKSSNYYAYFDELKQWAGDSSRAIRVRDTAGTYDEDLPSYDSLEDGNVERLSTEIYAYYLGLYINNMHQKISLDYLLSFPVTYEKEIRERILKLEETYGLKIDPDWKIYEMSVSEKQTVEIIKVLYRGADILILDEPTKGVDIGSKAQIYRIMSDLASEGIGILMISSEMPEVMNMSDRIYVMCEGRVTKEFTDVKNLSQEEILMAAMDMKDSEKEVEG